LLFLGFVYLLLREWFFEKVVFVGLRWEMEEQRARRQELGCLFGRNEEGVGLMLSIVRLLFTPSR
jgi:hypothetical protein